MDDTLKDIQDQNKPRNNGKVLAGMILLVVGGILLLKQFDYLEVPGWIWSWPTWIIIFGLYSGYKHNFQNSTWVILLIIGGMGIIDYAVPGLHMANFIWPVAIISIGIWIIMRRNHTWDRGKWEHKRAKHWDKDKWEKEWKEKWDAKYAKYGAASQSAAPAAERDASAVPPIPPKNLSGDDFLDATSIFGGVKKTILSKNFRGGDITNIFGGSEIDLTMADIDGRVILDITQLFGGTKIIVPPHWQVVSNLSAVFAGVDDKRLRKAGSGDNNKILVLEGISIFAGVEIRTF